MVQRAKYHPSGGVLLACNTPFPPTHTPSRTRTRSSARRPTKPQEVYFTAKRQQFLVDQGYSYKVIPSLLDSAGAAEAGLLSSRDEQLDVLAAILAAGELEGIEEDAAETDAISSRSVGDGTGGPEGDRLAGVLGRHSGWGPACATSSAFCDARPRGSPGPGHPGLEEVHGGRWETWLCCLEARACGTWNFLREAGAGPRARLGAAVGWPSSGARCSCLVLRFAPGRCCL